MISVGFDDLRADSEKPWNVRVCLYVLQLFFDKILHYLKRVKYTTVIKNSIDFDYFEAEFMWNSNLFSNRAPLTSLGNLILFSWAITYRFCLFFRRKTILCSTPSKTATRHPPETENLYTFNSYTGKLGPFCMLK